MPFEALKKTLLSTALLVVALPLVAQPPIVCEPPDDKCGSHIVAGPGGCDKCPEPGPPNVILTCEYPEEGERGYICEAYPQGFGVSYSWSVDPGLQIRSAANPTHPIAVVVCDGAANSPEVEVTVYLASGLSGKKELQVNCPSIVTD